jgi:hypothetical protein
MNLNRVVIGVLAVVVAGSFWMAVQLDQSSQHDFWVNVLASVAWSSTAALILALVWRRFVDWFTAGRWRPTREAMDRAICARLGAVGSVLHDLYCPTLSELAGYGSAPWQQSQRPDEMMDWVHAAGRMRALRDEVDAMTYGPITRIHGQFGDSGPTEMSVLAPPRPGWTRERWLAALDAVDRPTLARVQRAASLIDPHLDHLRLVLFPRLLDLAPEHERPRLAGHVDAMDVAVAQWQRAARLVATIDEAETVHSERRAKSVETMRRWLHGEAPPSGTDMAWLTIDYESRNLAAEIDAALGALACVGALYLPLAVSHAEEPLIAQRVAEEWNSEMIHARKLDAFADVRLPVGRVERVLFRLYGGWRAIAEEHIAKQDAEQSGSGQTERPGDLTLAELRDQLDDDQLRLMQQEIDRRKGGDHSPSDLNSP